MKIRKRAKPDFSSAVEASSMVVAVFSCWFHYSKGASSAAQAESLAEQARFRISGGLLERNLGSR
jgi:hypothetical protein